MADEKTFTQEDVNNIVADRLMRERGKFSDYDTLKEKVGTLDTLQTQYNELKAKVALAETESIKSKILSEAGLPKELATRLSGATEEEMKADAEVLKKLFGTKTIGSGTNPADSTNQVKTYTKAEINQMSPEDINANWDAIQGQMSKGLLR